MKDTNQASEDELMGELRLLYGRRISSNLSLAEYMLETRQLIQKLIRTEKLKLLDRLHHEYYEVDEETLDTLIEAERNKLEAEL